MRNKFDVFCDSHGLEGAILPDLFGVSQGAHPACATTLIVVAKRLARKLVIEKDQAGAGDSRVRLVKRFQLATDASWLVPFIVVPVEDEFSTGLIAGEISFRADVAFVREAEVADTRVGREKIENGVGAVIHNN